MNKSQSTSHALNALPAMRVLVTYSQHPRDLARESGFWPSDVAVLLPKPRMKWVMRSEKGRTVYDCLPCKRTGRTAPPIDARVLLGRLLTIATESDALDFLNATGFTYPHTHDRGSRRRAAFDELQSLRELIKDAQVTPFIKWPTLKNRYPHYWIWPLLSDQLSMRLICNADPPHLAVTTSSALDAIGVLIKLDKLQGIEYKWCERSDCPNSYRIETRHKRKYCSPECAHIVAVRNSRARK